VTSRVLLVVSTLDGAGPGRVMAILARNLVERGIEPLLVATHGPTDSQLVRSARDSGVAVANLGMRSMWDPRGAIRLLRLVHRWRPDIVHTRTIRADLLGRAAAGAGVPVVNNVVNLYPQDCIVRLGPVVGRAVMAIARATRGAARMFVANARAVADNARDAFAVPQERIHVVYDGLLLDEWERAAPADLARHGIGPSERMCLTVARLHPQKGIEDLVAAASLVAARRDDVRFVVAGDGPESKTLTELVRAAGLERSVILLGERRDVPNLMARADLFVLPSRFEGLPSAIIEAMAAGRAVVATAIAGVPEMVDEGVTGWLVPVSDARALAERVQHALGADLTDLESAARRRARERFSAAAMAQGFSTAYEVARGA